MHLNNISQITLYNIIFHFHAGHNATALSILQQLVKLWNDN